jgi:hypothetical protein
MNHMGEIATADSDILHAVQYREVVASRLLSRGTGWVSEHGAQENVWKQVRGSNRANDIS